MQLTTQQLVKLCTNLAEERALTLLLKGMFNMVAKIMFLLSILTSRHALTHRYECVYTVKEIGHLCLLEAVERQIRLNETSG